MCKRKKPFVLGDDVARALDDIVSINDNLPPEFVAKMEARKRKQNDDAALCELRT